MNRDESFGIQVHAIVKMNDELCRLCLVPSTDCLNIFSGNGISERKMVDILSEHFKCNVTKSTTFPSQTCAKSFTFLT